MNRLFKLLSLIAVVVLLAVCYKARTTQAASVPLDYAAVFYKSLDDRSVTDFIAKNHCASSGIFQLCYSAGVAFRVNRHKFIEQVYLYVDETSGFVIYVGELPFGITVNDTMADVEKKMGHPKVTQMPLFGWEPGLPDFGGTPDHMHYWATYKQFDITIVYNTPSVEDKSASMYMVIFNIEMPIMPIGRKVIL